MIIKSKEKRIIVKEITLETLEDRAIMLAMIKLALETKNFPVRAENELFKAFNISRFSEEDGIQDMLKRIKIQMY